LVPIQTYHEVKQRSQKEGRSISGQLQIHIAESEAFRKSHPMEALKVTLPTELVES
jgi:hypothetical protein